MNLGNIISFGLFNPTVILSVFLFITHRVNQITLQKVTQSLCLAKT